MRDRSTNPDGERATEERRTSWRSASESARLRRAGAAGKQQEARPLPAGERDFRRELARRLDLLQREVESLRLRVERLPRESSTEYLEMLDALQLRADRLEHQVGRFLRGGTESWESFRDRSEETWIDLKRSLLRIALSIHRRHPEMEMRSKAGRPRR
jgi:hypothetical protein